MSRADRAEEYFRKGYNCSQSVVLAFLDEMKIDFDTAAKMSLPFGGGLGRMRLTCGTVSGMAMVAGLLFGESDGTAQHKNEQYALTQSLAAKFKEKNGTLICGELLAGHKVLTDTSFVSERRSEEYYKKRPCIEYIREATVYLDQVIEERKI